MKTLRLFPKEIILQSFKKTLFDAWIDGSLSVEELAIIDTRKTELKITEQEHSMIEREVQILCYEENLKKSWKDGSINQSEQEELERLRRDLKISAEQHLELEQKVRRMVQTPPP